MHHETSTEPPNTAKKLEAEGSSLRTDTFRMIPEDEKCVIGDPSTVSDTLRATAQILMEFTDEKVLLFRWNQVSAEMLSQRLTLCEIFFQLALTRGQRLNELRTEMCESNHWVIHKDASDDFGRTEREIRTLKKLKKSWDLMLCIRLFISSLTVELMASKLGEFDDKVGFQEKFGRLEVLIGDMKHQVEHLQTRVRVHKEDLDYELGHLELQNTWESVYKVSYCCQCH